MRLGWADRVDILPRGEVRRLGEDCGCVQVYLISSDLTVEPRLVTDSILIMFDSMILFVAMFYIISLLLNYLLLSSRV